MRRLLLPILLLTTLAVAPVRAQDADAGGPAPAAPASTPAATDPLDKLFVDLRREPDAKKSRQISERIWARWRQSGSATVDMLIGWADTAIGEKKNALALDLLDRAIVLDPRYAESWNKRATLHYMMGNHAKSMSDINRVLALEPRHFGALSGMAGILEEAGKDELALKAWQTVLTIWPANRNAQTRAGELADKLTGRGI